MPALLSSCRRAGDEARFDSGEQISCIIQNPPGPGDATTPARSASDPLSLSLSLGKKSLFNLSSRPNNAPLSRLSRSFKEAIHPGKEKRNTKEEETRLFADVGKS